MELLMDNDVDLESQRMLPKITPWRMGLGRGRSQGSWEVAAVPSMHRGLPTKDVCGLSASEGCQHVPQPTPAPRLNLSPQSYMPSAPPTQYSDFASYQHVQGINNDPFQGLAGVAWSSLYSPAKDDWTTYGPGLAVPAATPAQISYSPADLGAVQAPPGSGLGLLPASLRTPGVPLSPGGQRRMPYKWLRHSGSAVHSSGKTRTKDKYRVVYTDHQRLELEKEFHYSRYIIIQRKAELSISLGLTEKQVKIWFQNLRAKERKANKKKVQQQQQQS